ncbi:MAG: hypothetical protein IIY11_07485, partial [Clostridia bacterium]|nr:hypothetical protein [Clostridia bacterium]
YILMERSFSNTSSRNVVRMISSVVQPPYDDKKLGRGKLREKREAVLDYLYGLAEISEKELCYQTGSEQAVVRDLVKRGLVHMREVPFYMVERSDGVPESEAFVL